MKRPPIDELILSLAARPEGVAYKDLQPDYSHSYARLHVIRLADEGRLVRAAADLLTVRYFLSQDAADAWVRSRREREAQAKRRTSAHWGPDDPPYLPTDEAGRPLWKLTVAPPLPRVLRTNTHSVY